MPDDKRILELRPKEFGLVFSSLNDKRNQLRNEGKTTDAVDDVILKVAYAPNKRGRARDEAR